NKIAEVKVAKALFLKIVIGSNDAHKLNVLLENAFNLVNSPLFVLTLFIIPKICLLLTTIYFIIILLK
ncbi:MAG: hypothetical protein IJ018_04480, partial [Bacilli bacterium]|nr:hypothetical protein [Bacilli bacterium]